MGLFNWFKRKKPIVADNITPINPVKAQLLADITDNDIQVTLVKGQPVDILHINSVSKCATIRAKVDGRWVSIICPLSNLAYLI